MRMEQMKMAKQMVEMNKAALSNGFNAMELMQEQTEKMINSLLSQATWIPEEGRKAVSNWCDVCKKGREELKKSVDENFEKVESYFSQAFKSDNG